LQSSKRLRTLGIDPGLDRTGWAVVEQCGCRDPFLVSAGLVHTAAGTDLPRRLEIIFNSVREVIAAQRPDALAIEEMFFVKRAASQGATIQARGVIVLAGQLAGLSPAMYNPRRVKMTLTGNGAADKSQMQRIIQLVLKLDKPLSPDDVADAAAIALCHVKTAPYAAAVKAAKVKLR